MFLTERNRAAVHQWLSRIIDEEAVAELLSNIPARDIDEPATKDLVRAEIATVRTEIGPLRTELHRETGGLRTEIGQLRTEVHREAGGLRTEIGQLLTDLQVTTGDLRTEIETVRTEIQSTANRIITWAVGANVALLGLVLTLTRVT